jgi:Tfp pilus assembly protein PilN
VWLPAEVFFVRRIGLDPGAATEPQVELALEAGAPFALEQLYYGWLRSAAGDGALVFATHRRRFIGTDWAEAPTVWPAFLPLLLDPPAGARWRILQTDTSITVAAWDGTSPLPAVVLSRGFVPGDETAAREALLEEVSGRLGTTRSEAEEFIGPAEVRNLRPGSGWEIMLRGPAAGELRVRCEGLLLETADVRDRAVLQARRQRQRLNRQLWRGFAASLAGILLAGLLDLTVFAGDKLIAGQRGALAERAAEVANIETAQALGGRIEELAQRRFRPFEMLAVINLSRPANVQFIRCINQGQHTLEIEAQARDAASVGAFEAALRSVAALQSVEIRDVRLRDGLTTFQLTVVFKPAAFAEVGAKP